MTISTPPEPLLGATPRRRRTRVYRAVAVLAAGGVLTAVVGLPSLSGTTSATAYVGGRGGSGQTWGGPGSGAWGGSAGGTQTATVDSQAATDAQEKGVALIDTVLSNGEAAGTGIVLTSDGEVLTNYHVVEDSTSIRVTIASTGETYTASVVGASQSADIALLQLKDASGLTVARIDDDTVQLNDAVTAVGNAGGTGELSAADGQVTDLSTSITTASEGSVAGETLNKVIETDADVVAGDSGGPLVDAEGEVIGVDTAASSGTDINGYAIPIATALRIVTEIRDGEESSTVRIGPAAFLGVELSSTTASAYGRAGSGAGATVAGVVDGDAADDAGLVAGDTITRLGSTTISDASDLTTALSGREPGEKVTLTWTTADGRTDSATVTLGASAIN